jgi:hypothetical protein
MSGEEVSTCIKVLTEVPQMVSRGLGMLYLSANEGAHIWLFERAFNDQAK